jgi:predicted amidohydrolase YtcJ
MMKTHSFTLLVASAVLALLSLPLGIVRLVKAGEPSHLQADLVVINGGVWTVDPSQPRAEAVAIVGDRIAAVGSNSEIHNWTGPQTRVVDAGGKTVLPGFVDSHVHFSTGGFQISGVQLRDAATPEEFTRRIGEYAKKIPKGEWILNGDWDHELWGGAPPTRERIDKVTPDNPVFVSRYDGHMSLANSLALKLAGVTRDTPVPNGGEIVKDSQGNPTGLLKDAATELVFQAIPPPSEAQLEQAIEAALQEAARLGVTSFDDISSAADVRAYQNLLAAGKLTSRVYCITPLPDWESLAREGIMHGFGNNWIRMGAVKGFSDGSLGSTTALFFEPFNDAPNTSGIPNAMMFPPGNMLKMTLGSDRAGLQIAVHAVGDKANRMMLDTYAEMEKQDGPRDRRLRIEHAQHVRAQDFEDFHRSSVIASVQPYHAIDDGRWAEKRIGFERCKTTYAFRTFLDHGVRLAFGTDWTVAPLNPMLTLYAAVTRRTLDGKQPEGWFPEQKLTLQESIEAYTMGSAYAQFAEKQKGSITAGKLADIVVLDSELFALPPEKIRDARVAYTIAGGKIIYSAR